MRSDPDDPCAWLLVNLRIPLAATTDDPDLTADLLVNIINEYGNMPFDIEVGAIPAPQWLTPETLANLRASAAPVSAVGPVKDGEQ